MLPELTEFLARFEAVPVDLAQLRLPAGFQAIYVLFADGYCYFGRTNGPKKRWKEYRGGRGSGRVTSQWLQSLKSRGIEVQIRFLAYCPKEVVADVEDAFILWGKETFGDHCLNLADGTRPLSEVIEEARRKASSKANKNSPRVQDHIHKLHEVSRLPLPEHEIYALHKAGETQHKIAAKFGVSQTTIQRRLAKYADLLSWGLGPGF